MSQEIDLFEKTFNRVNNLLKITGIYLTEEDVKRTVSEHFLSRWYFCFNFLCLNIDVLGELAWIVNGIITGKSIIELTYITPCFTECILGNFKALQFIMHAHHAMDLVNTMRRFQTTDNEHQKYRSEVENEMVNSWIPFLSKSMNAVVLVDTVCIIMFGLSPLVISASAYISSGKIQLSMPFLILYPFNEYDLRIFPVLYIQQVWSSVTAVFSVVGPDIFFCLICAFIHIQFKALQYDFKKIITEDQGMTKNEASLEFRREFLKLVNRHRELIRCVSLMETIYSKSSLCNVITSSLLICLTGFNVTVIDNLAITVPFMVFLSLGLLQIFFFCYYADLIMQSSNELSAAVYNCKWYTVEAKVTKDLLFVLIRAQKPCKVTAWNFFDLNLRAFNKIVSTAWSYFALLQSIYRK